MAFIDKTDYASSINSNILDDITKVDDTKIDRAESFAIEEMKGYLSARYDVDNIFNKTGNDRNPVILMYAMDVTLYHLHTLINARKIPDFRKERYKTAMEWLKLVQQEEINPPNLPIPADDTKDYFLFGSNPPRANRL